MLKKRLSLALLILGMIVLANGAVAFFLRYNFVTQEQYGPSLEPLEIMAAGIAVLVVWLALRTTNKK